MKSKYLNALFFLLLVTPSFAQVGIGTTAPDDSSLLEIKATNKGLLLPRVALTGSTDTATIAFPATSLLIYNTATTGTSLNSVTPGYYYYTGTQWERLTNSGANTLGAFTTATTNGATIAGGVLQLAPASITTGGIINTGAQTFAGTKTFNVDAIVNGVKVGRGTGNVTTNTTLGASALFSNTSGNNNTVVGYQALAYNNNGNHNSAFGANVLFYNTSGYRNSAFGSVSLASNTSGYYNSAFGAGSLTSNTSGYYNSAFGDSSLGQNLGGIHNAAFGAGSLGQNTSGGGNVAIGLAAGNNNKTGNFNTFLGYNAQPEFDDLENAIAIGAAAIVSADNTVQLENSSIADIYGGNPTGGSGTGAIFHGKSFVANSDARIKKDIVNSKYGLATILKLRPVDYHLINDVKQEPQVGFIAQEVKSVVPELVVGKEGDLDKGEILGVNYAGLTPVLTKAIQEQQKEIETLDAEMETSKDERKALKIIVEKLINKKQTPNQNEK